MFLIKSVARDLQLKLMREYKRLRLLKKPPASQISKVYDVTVFF